MPQDIRQSSTKVVDLEKNLRTIYYFGIDSFVLNSIVGFSSFFCFCFFLPRGKGVREKDAQPRRSSAAFVVMSMWEVLASDSSGDEEDEQSTSCSRSSSGTSNTSSASSDSESEVDRFAGAGFPGYEPSKRDQAEDVVRGVSPTIMDEVALEFMTSTPTNQRFRRSKKKKQKMMRRRTRHLHDSFALLERKTQRVSAGGLDEGDAVRHTDFLPSDNSDDSLSSSASDSRKSCSMPTKESTSLPPSKHSSATNEEPLHHYRHDLSVNCVFLLTSEEFSSVPLCPDHSGAFRSWAQAVLRESSFGDIAVVVNQHRARLAALASPDAQDESGSTNSKSAFDAWVAAEKARRVEAQRAAENVLVVYNSSKERVSVSDEAAATTLLDSTLRDTPGFALKSDANGCCACSCPTLNAKKRRAGTREALTTTSFPFLGAYMCYRLVHLLRAPLKQLCKIPAGPGRRLNSSAEDTLHKTRNGNSGHRSSSKNITHHNKHHHLPQPNTCKPRRSSNSNSTSSSSSAHSSDFDDASDHHVESSSFFIDSSGNVVIVAPQDSAEHALQADDDRDGDAGETDMWGVSFKGACQPPMSAAEAAVQAAAGSVLRAHTCAVCMEVLCHPCSLRRCGHIFCRGCLLSMLYSAARVRVRPHSSRSRRLLGVGL